MQKDNVKRIVGGIHTDNSSLEQPENTTRFVLNGVNETDLGDMNFISNEESNESCFSLPEGYTPLGKVYIGDGEVAIWSVSEDGTRSEIGIADSECGYTTHVNGTLGFKVTNQVDATYRLIRGCNKTVYWVDGDNNPPMTYDFNDPNKFKTGGFWDKKKFFLETSFEVYPEFKSIEVLEGLGVLEPGSYNFGILYVDENLNPTNVITTSQTINIYNSDSKSADFLDVEGSINSDEDAFDFPHTDKAISLELDVDTSYPYYRIAIIEYNLGTGMLSSVKYSDNIPTDTNIFTYTGENYFTEGVEEDLKFGGRQIASGDSIEQIDNRLIIANTKGQTGDMCVLQQFATKITADLVIKKVNGNSVTPGNTKSPTNHFEAVGYMPGEIYSFGLVLVFEDNTESPVYHIPGKNNSDDGVVYSPGDNVYPMSIDNSADSAIYVNNKTCSVDDYWGVDSKGELISNSPIRHHRFPYRSDIGVPMVTKEYSDTTTTNLIKIELTSEGDIDTPCTQEEVDNGECSPLTVAEPFQVRVEMFVDGATDYFYVDIDPEDYKTSTGSATISIVDISDELGSDVVIQSIQEEDGLGGWTTVPTGSTSDKGLVYTANLTTETYSKTKNEYEINVYGIKFSNISLSDINAVSDKKVIGYHIVRNQRTDNDRTILDSAILTPTVNSNNKDRNLWGKDPKDTIGDNHKTFNKSNLNPNYLAIGLLSPVFNRNNIQATYNSGALEIGGWDQYFLNPENRVSKEFFGLIVPEFRFNNKRYESYSRLRQEGTFNVLNRKYDTFYYNDVTDGTSYDKDVHKKKFEDDDGWSFRGGTRDSELIFSLENSGIYNFDKSQIKETVYVGALGTKDFESTWKFRNASADNSIGVVRLQNPLKEEALLNEFPYVYIERDLLNPYENFRSLPFYKVSTKLLTSDFVDIYDGDVYITPVRYFSTAKIEEQPAFRVNKNDVWKIIVGALIAVVAIAVYVLAVIFSWGTLAGLGTLFVGVAGFGVTMIKNGISSQDVINAYEEEYQDGLKECLMDADTFNGFKYYPSQDDEQQWFGEVLTDLWFESPVNTSLRHDSRESVSFFMSAPGEVQGYSLLRPGARHKVSWGGNKSVTLLKKETVAPITKVGRYFQTKILQDDENRANNKSTIGFPLGELYILNPDFDRMNKQKVFFPLGVEYDCCSNCLEDFPHRVWYSEQSFQEELTDNYRIFQPMNYRDIQGESGKITDLFVMMNNLYIHTEEALWHLPQNYQERVTDQLTTYIGTGEFFAIPPRKILDDEQQSGGSQHKWATIKAGGHGVFFVGEREKKIFKFNGESLKSIPEGNSKWFLNNIGLSVPKDFKNSNNPSNKRGVGFISIYDPEKERIIFTKKDYKLIEGSDIIYNPDLGYYAQEGEICDEGYTYDPEKQVCYKEEEVEKQPIGESISVNSVGTSSHGFATPAIYTSYNSDGTADVDPLSSTGYTFENITNPWWVGGGVVSQRYVNLLAKWVTGASLRTWYGGVKLVDVPSTKTYYVALAADDEFRFSVDGVVILTSDAEGMNPQHNRSFGAPFVKIHIYPVELEAGCRLIKVEGLNEEADGLFAASILDNTYSEIVNSTSQADLNEIYSTQHITELFEDGFIMECPEDSVPLGKDLCDKCLARDEKPLNITRIDFEDKRYFNDSSWTISYALPNEQRQGNIWVSWHSYMPRFYLRNKESFYSWNSNFDVFWKHNVLGNYQTFYNVYHPHIVEYVSNSNPIETRIWEDITLNTEAKKYMTAEEFYVDERFITFNKMIAYNTRQNTGLLNLKVKENEDADYLSYQVEDNTPGTIKIDRDERSWHINDLRDIVVDHSIPMFRKDITSLSTEYYIDKVLNTASLDVNKEWFDLESLRDKYLVIRLIFDNFDDIRLITNFTSETETQSFR